MHPITTVHFTIVMIVVILENLKLALEILLSNLKVVKMLLFKTWTALVLVEIQVLGLVALGYNTRLLIAARCTDNPDFAEPIIDRLVGRGILEEDGTLLRRFSFSFEAVAPSWARVEGSHVFVSLV